MKNKKCWLLQCMRAFFFLEKKKYAMKSLKFYPDTAVQSSIKKEWRVKRSRYRKEKYG